LQNFFPSANTTVTSPPRAHFCKTFSFFFRHYYGERACLFQIGQQKSSKSFSRLTASDAAVVDSDYSVFILESDFLH
jgi:hypothetical protein